MEYPPKERFNEEELKARKAARDRRIEALKRGWAKPGEVRNPTGKNSRQMMATMRRALDVDGAREELCAVAIEKAIDGDVAWARFCAEYDDGKPVQSSEVDVRSSDGSMSPVGAFGTSEEMIRKAQAILLKEQEADGDPPNAGTPKEG